MMSHFPIFWKMKKARNFNFEELLGKTIKTAQDRSKETLQKREDEEREAKEKKTEAQNEKKGLD